jgi:hypothetical protein
MKLRDKRVMLFGGGGIMKRGPRRIVLIRERRIMPRLTDRTVDIRSIRLMLLGLGGIMHR